MKRKLYMLILVVVLLVLSVGGSSISKSMIMRSHSLYRGVSIVLDAGHGGKDKGAQVEDIYESDLNLIYVKKLKNQLEQLGMHVILTRNSDTDLSDTTISSRKSADLKNRVKIINENKVDLFISIHMNIYADKEVKGAQVFYKKGNKDSEKFASYLQSAISKGTKTKMKSKSGNYYILNNTDKIGVLLECGFLSNEQERKKLCLKEYQDHFVAQIRNGIVAFLQDVYE